MKTKLSNSSVDKYLECSLCWRLHYLEGIRPVTTGSPLVFGGAIDKALNELLLTRDLKKAKEIFNTEWTLVQNLTNVKYSKSDLDIEIVHHFNGFAKTNIEWHTLYYKGLLFIEAYYNEVLPKIKKVIAVQEPITIKNADGDEIIGNLDLIVEWEDGKTYLMDNKTSSIEYSKTSAKDGQQLPLYYYAVKDKYKLNGIGYIVLYKKINKNKIKKCKSCMALNETTHKTCNTELVIQNGEDGFKHQRCGGEFEITINPTVDVQYIFNQVEESDIDRTIETFDQVNYCISNGMFSDTHTQERGKFGYCPYKEYTLDSKDFYKKEKK